MSTSAIEPPLSAPAFADLKFTKIGQPPALLQRMQSPDIKTEYRTPSPTPSGAMIHGGLAPQASSMSRPTLFQSLGDTPPQHGETSTMIASQPLNAIFSAVQPSASVNTLTPRSSASSRVTAGSAPSVGVMHAPSLNVPSTGLTATIPPLASPSAPHASSSIARPSSLASTSGRDISEDDSFPSGSVAPESSSPPAPLPINLSAGAKNTDNLSRLLKLTSTRHDSVPKIQKRFDNKTADLAELMAKAQEGAEAVEAQLDSLTKVAEMTRQQSDRMMQEALKTREFAERLYAEAEQVKLDVQKAKEQTKDASKHSEDLFVFSRRLFVWLHELVVRESPLIEALRQEMEKHTESQRHAETEAAEERKKRDAEAAAAAEARRLAEEQRRAAEEQRLAAEAEEKTRQAEEERRRAAEVAFEAQRAREKQRLAEEERFKEEKEKEYQAKRAAVQASKQRAREAEAVQIRLAREQDLRSKSGSASMDVSPERAESDKNLLSSNIAPSVSTPMPTPAPVPRITVPTTVAAPPVSKSPIALVSPHASLPPRPPPAVIAQAHKNESKNAEASSQKTRKAPAMPFVAAQTEAGRQVNTDMPFGSTELARESLTRKKDTAPQKNGQTSRSPSTRRANAQSNAQSHGQPKRAKKAARNAERGSATTAPASGSTHPTQHSKMPADRVGPPSARAEPSLIPNAAYAEASQPPPVISFPNNVTSSYPDIPVTNGWAPEIYRDPRPDNLGDGGWGGRASWGVSPPPDQSIRPEPSTSHHINGQHVDMRRVSDTERYRCPPGDHYSPPPPDHRGAPSSRKRTWDGPQYEDDRISPPRQRARVSPEYDHGLDHRIDPHPSRFDRSPSPVPATYSRADYCPYSDRDYDRRGLTPYDYLVADSYHTEDYPEGYGPVPIHPAEYDSYRHLSPGTPPGLSPDASYGANGWPDDNDLGFDEPLVVDGSPTALHHRSLESRMGDPPQPGSSNRRGGSGNSNQNNRRGSAQTSSSRGRGQGQGRGRGPANRGRDQNAAKPSLANRIQRSLKDRVEKD